MADLRSDIVPVAQMLQHHEDKSEARHHALAGQHHEIIGKLDDLHELHHEAALSHKHIGEHKMSDPFKVENIFKPGHGSHDGGGGMMGGIGGGVLGGVLASALFRRGGILGGDGDAAAGGVVTPTMLSASLDGVQANANNLATMQMLGDIKASVPLAESQVQLALAGATSEIITNQALTNKNVSDGTAAVLASQNNINQNVSANGTANLIATNNAAMAVERTGWAVTTAVTNDGAQTRALITAQNEANLNRMLAVAESALAESRFNSRARETEINVTQNVNQNQNQMQQQQQMQTLLGTVNALVASHQFLQQGIVNLGTMTGNSQTAANTRVN